MASAGSSVRRRIMKASGATRLRSRRELRRGRPNIMQTVRFPTRMDAVQAPVIAVIGGIIREVPGTISLGQGVVHYGPPPAALDAVRLALTEPSTHEYQDGAGLDR